MTIYYFDFRDGSELVIDEEGIELRDVLAAQVEAGRAVADFARDAIRLEGAQGQQVIVGVRDAHGPVMQVTLSFEIARKQEAAS
jgi:hypothetical protein